MENKIIIRYIKMYHANICDWQSLNIIQQNVLIDLVRKWFIVERSENKRRHVSIGKIREVVCEFYKIPNSELDLKTNKRKYVEPRQVCHYLAVIKTVKSYVDIGFQIGRKDHSTVSHAFKTVTNLMKTDKHYKEKINQIKLML